MKIEYKLIDGTIVIGDKHIDSDYYTNVIRIYKPEDNSELEDCTYDVTCVKESDIVYRKFINLDYDDLMEYISLVEQTIKEELKQQDVESDNYCECKSCPDCDCEDCDSTPKGNYEFKNSNDNMYS